MEIRIRETEIAFKQADKHDAASMTDKVNRVIHGSLITGGIYHFQWQHAGELLAQLLFEFRITWI